MPVVLACVILKLTKNTKRLRKNTFTCTVYKTTKLNIKKYIKLKQSTSQVFIVILEGMVKRESLTVPQYKITFVLKKFVGSS